MSEDNNRDTHVLSAGSSGVSVVLDDTCVTGSAQTVNIKTATPSGALFIVG